MRWSKLSIQFLLIYFFLLTATVIKAQNNSISGIVFDQTGRQPVSQIYVELLNEVYSTLKRVKTDGSGRYYFSAISSGNFKVKVLTTGTNFEEQIQEVSIINFGGVNRRPSSDNIYLDFYLKLNPRKINTKENHNPGSVFIQEVPINARKLYEKGVAELEDKKDSGLKLLEQAIEIFPNYFDALDKLGGEYIQRKEYLRAATYLVKAIDINQRSFTSFYALGFASYKLNHLQEAIEAMRAATILNPKSVNAKIWYGRLLRMDGNYESSEKVLLQAKSLVESSPVADVYWELALVYEKLKKFKAAANELENFLKVQPDSRDAKQIRQLIVDFKNKQ